MSEKVNPGGTRFPAAVGFEEKKADSGPSKGGANKLIDTISRRLIDGNKKLNASNAKEIAKSLNSLGYGDRTNAMLKSILRRTQRGREQGQRRDREAMIVEGKFKRPTASAAARTQGAIEAQRSPTELARRQREVAAIRKMNPDVGEQEALSRSLRPRSNVERFAIQKETESPHPRTYQGPHGMAYRTDKTRWGSATRRPAEPRVLERTQQLHAAQMLAENTDPSNPFAGMNYQDISRHLDGESGKHVFEQLFGFPISSIR